MLKVQVFQVIGHQASKILDYQSFSAYFENLGLSNRKTWTFTLIIQDFRLIAQSKSKILNFRLKSKFFKSQCPII